MNIAILLFLFLVLLQAEVFPTDQTEFYKNLEPATSFYTETGYVSVDGPKNQFFYHLFLKEGTLSLNDVKETDNFILWLNGGPGCASLMHIFQNVGPYHTVKKAEGDFTVKMSDSAWSQVAHTIFVDQPFNVGLSYGADVFDSVSGAKLMVDFLQQFFTSRPQFVKTKFYVFGVSYGGHYVPALGAEILKSTLMETINFQGIGVGNGWVDPSLQFSSYAPMLQSLGVMSEKNVELTKNQMLKAQQALFQGDNEESSKQGFFGIFYLLDKYTGHMSPYSYQDQLDYTAPYEDIYAGFINQYKNQFKVPNQIVYTACNNKVGDNFVVDISNSYKETITFILQKDKRVLIYNGSFDVICNTPGVNAFLNTISWEKLPQWKASPKQTWKALNPITNVRETAGTIKKFDNLYYATVYKAGHMAPDNLPIASLEMLKHFLFDEDWN